MEDCYIAIDLKSFYASVECVQRGLDPLKTCLVVADTSRTDKTICLAVTPALKAYGIPGRARLFEVNQAVERINSERLRHARGREFSGSSYLANELARNSGLALDFIAATPQMALYMDVSARIYDIYLRYVSAEDMHVYSIDEVFIYATPYLKGRTPREFAMALIGDVLHETGITATVGIGTNLYLSKIAMDIDAKHMPADENGVRIAELDEMSYRKRLWTHTPLTDFWRIGKGISRRLEKYGVRTMGDLARLSLLNEDTLYYEFGVNAELLIDHAWGFEPCRMTDIKSYTSSEHSVSSGQVLSRPYTHEEGRIILREMASELSLDLAVKHLVTDQIVLAVAFDSVNLTQPGLREAYTGEIVKDYYGRPAPKPAHGSFNLGCRTASTKLIMNAVLSIYESQADPVLMIRRVSVTANHVVPESQAASAESFLQYDLFSEAEEREKLEQSLKKEKRMQDAIIGLRKKYGKNIILRGTSHEEAATMRERNNQIGGHRA